MLITSVLVQLPAVTRIKIWKKELQRSRQDFSNILLSIPLQGQHPCVPQAQLLDNIDKQDYLLYPYPNYKQFWRMQWVKRSSYELKEVLGDLKQIIFFSRSEAGKIFGRKSKKIINSSRENHLSPSYVTQSWIYSIFGSWFLALGKRNVGFRNMMI